MITQLTVFTTVINEVPFNFLFAPMASFEDTKKALMEFVDIVSKQEELVKQAEAEKQVTEEKPQE